MFKMDTGEFKMAPLSDFSVTFTDHRVKPDVDITFDDWYNKAGRPGFNVEHTPTELRVVFSCKKPEGLNVVMPPNKPPYVAVWS